MARTVAGRAADRQLVERTAAHLSHSQLARLESYLPFLATTGNITPFVGLLGTVMGIIDAFREIGAQGTASIAAVAPGVAEALIATAAGLFTAIPAVIAYNYFLSRIRRTAFRLDTVTIELMTSLSVPVGKGEADSRRSTAMMSESRQRRFMAEINVIPLVDVVLVLLVIFMVTAPMLYRGMDINLPKSATNTIRPEMRTVLTIEKDQRLYLGQGSSRRRAAGAEVENPET